MELVGPIFKGKTPFIQTLQIFVLEEVITYVGLRVRFSLVLQQQVDNLCVALLSSLVEWCVTVQEKYGYGILVNEHEIIPNSCMFTAEHELTLSLSPQDRISSNHIIVSFS